MRRRITPITPIFDPEPKQGTTNPAGTPSVPAPILIAVHVSLSGGYVDPLFLVAGLNLDVTASVYGILVLADITITGPTGGEIIQFADFIFPNVVSITNFREWGDIDLAFANPPVGASTTDGPFTVTYPFLLPGYVHPTANVFFVGVAALSANRIVTTHKSTTDGTHTKFVILDTTDKNVPTVVSSTDMVGYPWGSKLTYDAAADRVYLGGFASSGTVMDISDETNPVQGDVWDVAANPVVIGTNLIIGCDGFDDRYATYDTTTLGAWTQLANILDATNFNAPQDLLNIGGNRVLAVMPDRISIIDVTTPSAPTGATLFTAASVGASSFDGFTRDGNTVYVTGLSPTAIDHIHVTSLDVTTPSAPSVISSADIDTNLFFWSRANTPRVIDGDLWVYGEQLLARVNISNPASMSLMDAYGLSGVSHADAWSHDALAVQAGYAWWTSLFSFVWGLRTA